MVRWLGERHHRPVRGRIAPRCAQGASARSPAVSDESNALQAVSGVHFGTCTRAPDSPSSPRIGRQLAHPYLCARRFRSFGRSFRRLSGESSPSLARMDRRRFRGQPGAVGRRLTARASLSSGCHATDTGARLRRSVRGSPPPRFREWDSSGGEGTARRGTTGGQQWRRHLSGETSWKFETRTKSQR